MNTQIKFRNDNLRDIFSITSLIQDISSTAVKLFFVCTVTLGVFNSLLATMPVYEWSFSSGGNMQDYVHSSKTDRNGNLYIAGEYRGSTQLGATQLVSTSFLGMFIAKISQDGECLWFIQPSGEHSGVINSISIDNEDNIICTGSYGGTAIFGKTVLDTNASDYDGIFVSKLDTNGNWLWAKHVASYYSLPVLCLLSVDDSCNVYVSSELVSTHEFGTTTLVQDSGLIEIFIAKLDTNGDWLWAKKNTEHINLRCMITDNESNVYLAGSYPNSEFEPADLYEAFFGYDDIYLAKYSASGELIWEKKLGSRGTDVVHGMAIDRQSNIYLTGSSSGEINFGDILLTSNGYREVFVAKMTKQGDFVWASRPGGDYARTGLSIVVDSMDNVYVAGFFSDSAMFGTSSVVSNGNEDGFIAKLDSDGLWVWGQSIGSINNDRCTTISLYQDTIVYVGGVYIGTVSIGDTVLYSNGSSDVFVMKLTGQ